MANDLKLSDPDLRHLRWPYRLTRSGLVCERFLRAFWPAIAVLLVALAALMFGLQDIVPVEGFWVGALAVGAALLAALVSGARKFQMPTRDEAMDRLDATLPGRPIAAIADTQAIGAGDGASEHIWKTHVARMADRARDARAVEPDLKLSRQDPYALRYVALLAFLAALLFGSVWRVSSVNDIAAGGSALAAGPTWEAWVEPPGYTGRPSLYLNDIDRASLSVPQGSEVTLRLYGEVGALTVSETVSGRIGELPAASEPVQTFQITQAGRLAVDGPGGQGWDINIIADAPPTIEVTAPIERTVGGEFRQPFAARDDYGVIAGHAEISIDLDRVDRRYGLVTEPEPRETIALDLPLTISGDRADFEETLIDDLAKHPWAGLPIDLQLFATDASGQIGESEVEETILPARRFFDPLASAVIEQRRDLLWNRDNAPRISAVLRAISFEPDDVFTSETAYLKLRVAIRRLETSYRHGEISDELLEETAEILWEIALQIEEGNLSDALERLRRAQDRLADAIENGATDEEIAELMQELREAMQEYMRQLAEESQQNPQTSQNQEGQEITGNQLEEMMQRLQELMEQGRTEEAMALLEQLRQLMENMQIAEGQQGEGQQGEGQHALEGLAETLREQQGLSDETFQDLQEQFGQQQGQQPGQQPGQQGQGQQGQQQGQGGEQQQGQGQGSGPNQEQLAERQRALRQELQRQQQGLPGAGTAEGDAAREALDRAGRAMDDAEEALRDEDFAGALDEQSEAIEALREGMRELGEQLAQQQGQPGEQGEAAGNQNPQGRRDPLGREAGENGRIGTDEELLTGDDVYRRARELLEEIQRRSSEQSRPDVELDYLRRLLDRF